MIINIQKIIKAKYFVNFSSQIGSRAFIQLLAFVSLPIISRVLGPSRFGEIIYANVIIFYASILNQFGFNQYLIVEISQSNKNVNIISEILSIRILTSLFLISIILLILLISNLIKTPVGILVAINSASLFFSALDLSGYYYGKEKMTVPVITQSLGAIVNVILVIFFVKTPDDVYLVAIFYVIYQALGFTLMMFFYKDKIYSLTFDFPKIKYFKHYKYSIHLGLSNILDQVSKNAAPLLIGLFLTTAQLGIYNGAERIYQYIMFFFISLMTTYMPLIYRSCKNKTKTDLQKLNIIFYSLLIIGLLVTLSTYFLSKLIIILVFGNAFVESASILKLWSLIMFTIPISMFIGNVMIGQGKTNDFLKLTITVTCISIIMTFLAVKYYGFVGAFYTQFLINIFYFIATLLYIKFSSLFTFKEILQIINLKNVKSNITEKILNA